MFNPYSAQKRLELQIACAYNAVHSSFRYLPLRYIIQPPRQLLEAALARQIAVHLLRTVFNVPRRRIATALGRQRTTISFNIQRINRRLQEPVFAREYERIANRARAAFERQMQKNTLAKAA